MNWSEPKPPTDNVSYYDHTILETPIGVAIIEWKSWKDQPSYDIQLDGNWLGVEYTLGDAKTKVHEYLQQKYDELGELLKNS
jgi:hypothetical protein